MRRHNSSGVILAMRADASSGRPNFQPRYSADADYTAAGHAGCYDGGDVLQLAPEYYTQSQVEAGPERGSSAVEQQKTQRAHAHQAGHWSGHDTHSGNELRQD
jgi:hypothetical protein